MKRFFAVFLTLALLLACAPNAFAEDPQIAPESVGALTERPQETSAGGNSAEDPQNTTASVAISDVSAAVEAAEVIGWRSVSARGFDIVVSTCYPEEPATKDLTRQGYRCRGSDPSLRPG